MSKSIKLEALIAWPPTSKCRKTIEVLEEVVRRHPDEVKLVVFNRGAQEFPEEPSRWLSVMIHKGSPVPVCLVGGEVLCTSEVPKLEDVEARVWWALRTGK
jgi:hypothetical protein